MRIKRSPIVAENALPSQLERSSARQVNLPIDETPDGPRIVLDVAGGARPVREIEPRSAEPPRNARVPVRGCDVTDLDSPYHLALGPGPHLAHAHAVERPAPGLDPERHRAAVRRARRGGYKDAQAYRDGRGPGDPGTRWSPLVPPSRSAASHSHGCPPNSTNFLVATRPPNSTRHQ